MDRANATATGSEGTFSADNVLRLQIELAERGRIRVFEAADYLGVARSTAHRLLTVLTSHGLATRDTQGSAYLPGPALATLSQSPRPRPPLISLVEPIIQALRDETEETAHFAVLQGNGVRFVVGFEGFLENRTPRRTGLVLPAHATAVGKAMLAALPSNAVRALYPRGVQTLTDTTLTSLQAVIEHLGQVARLGYAVNRAEAKEGVSAVGVVVRDSAAAPVGAVAVAAPVERMPAARWPHVVTRIQRAALDIQAGLLDPN